MRMSRLFSVAFVATGNAIATPAFARGGTPRSKPTEPRGITIKTSGDVHVVDRVGTRVLLHATTRLTLGVGVSMAAAARDELDIRSFCNSATDGLRVRPGIISMEWIDPSSSGPRVISLNNSSIINAYTTSDITLYAGSIGHPHEAGDAIHLVKSRVESHAQGNVFFDPIPT